jgi:sulfur carrier protein
MKIKVNGEIQEVKDGLTIADFVKQLELDETRLVVELNAEIVLKSQFSSTKLDDGDVIELVEFVAGG